MTGCYTIARGEREHAGQGARGKGKGERGHAGKGGKGSQRTVDCLLEVNCGVEV